MVIQKTLEYKKFKFGKDNRAIDPALLTSLINSISKRDLTKYKPVLVSKNMYIIDGQHRFNACVELAKPIYYEILVDCQENDIVRLNSASKNWTMDNYLKHYISKGKSNYILFNDLLTKYNLNISELLMINKESWSTHYVEFKNGDYEVIDVKDLVSKLDNLDAIKLLCPKFSTKPNIRGYIKVFNSPNFDKDRFLANLNKCLHFDFSTYTQRQGLDLIENIYNFHRNKRERLF